MKIREFSLPAAAAASIAIVSALLSGCEQAASQPQLARVDQAGQG